jgi:hypothetical protein
MMDSAVQFFTDRGVTLEAETVKLAEADVEAKIQAISRYQSQLSTWWENIESMQQAVKQYLLRVGNGTPAERYWRVPAQ